MRCWPAGAWTWWLSCLGRGSTATRWAGVWAGGRVGGGGVLGGVLTRQGGRLGGVGGRADGGGVLGGVLARQGGRVGGCLHPRRPSSLPTARIAPRVHAPTNPRSPPKNPQARFQDVAFAESPLWEMPVFSFHDGYLTTSYNDNLNRWVLWGGGVQGEGRSSRGSGGGGASGLPAGARRCRIHIYI